MHHEHLYCSTNILVHAPTVPTASTATAVLTETGTTTRCPPALPNTDIPVHTRCPQIIYTVSYNPMNYHHNYAQCHLLAAFASMFTLHML